MYECTCGNARINKYGIGTTKHLKRMVCWEYLTLISKQTKHRQDMTDALCMK